MGWLGGMIEEVRLNLSPGVLAWAMHRVTGILLVLYLLAHFAVLGTSLQGAGAFESAIAGLGGPLFTFLESAIVVIVAYHMFNGLRIIAVEFASLTRQQRRLFRAVIAGSLATMTYTGWVFFERVLG